MLYIAYRSDKEINVKSNKVLIFVESVSAMIGSAQVVINNAIMHQNESADTIVACSSVVFWLMLLLWIWIIYWIISSNGE
jgi:hypothetical protein